MKLLQRSDDGATVAVAKGDEFEVQLPENGTTGYTWGLSALPPGVALVADGLVGPMPAQAGAGRDHQFRFAVTGMPDGPLRLVLRRFWEQPPRAEDSFEVRLTAVSPAAEAPW